MQICTRRGVTKVNPGPIRIATSPATMNFTHCLATTLLALSAAPLAHAAVSAQDDKNLPSCIHLGPEQQIIRTGGAQQFQLRNGNELYLVSLTHSCSGLPQASKGMIERDGLPHMLCQRGSQLKTDRGTCTIQRVQSIESEQGNQDRIDRQ